MSVDTTLISKQFNWPKDELTQRVFSYIVKTATELMDVNKIILYGSRARGDFHRTSDFDFAFEINDDREQWTRFYVDVPDNLVTLLDIDLVRMDEVNESFKKNILRDGKVIYAGR